MKKVILFTDNLGSGGAQRQVTNVAVLLKKAGYDVSVLVYQDIPFYKPLLDENDVPVVFVESKGTASRMLGIRKYLNKS
ncbi:MAG: glycosyltransferase family 1 protein, partial [Clostridia bacterium]|nr:glycosyltransferase family 1 protein [Clostridia bacterium]